MNNDELLANTLKVAKTAEWVRVQDGYATTIFERYGFYLRRKSCNDSTFQIILTISDLDTEVRVGEFEEGDKTGALTELYEKAQEQWDNHINRKEIKSREQFISFLKHYDERRGKE